VKAIDGLLNIVARQGATELRLASNRPPRLFRDAEELALTMPATSPEAMKTLLDLSEHEAALNERGSAVFIYRSAEAGDFDVKVTRATGGDLGVRFVRRAPGSAPPPAAPAPAAAAKPAPAPEPPRPPAPAPPPRVASEPQSLPPALASLLERAVSARASDIHLTQGREPILRIDGELRPLHDAEPFVVSALLDAAQRERVEAGRALDLGLEAGGIGRLRINIYASTDGLCAAIRLLSREAPRLGQLNLPPAVQALVQLPHGLVLVTGPTGSGKSTTLAALAQEALRARPQVLITLEDPLEYRLLPGREGGLVRQREIGRHVSDFASGLRDALREDPDILLIGEMRDAETIGLALTAAETGHLVLASLHSRTSTSAVERIVDTYPPERQRQIRVQLADALRAVVSQTLLPRADGRGRVPAVEFLRVNHGVANLIRDGRTPQILSALQAGREEGMVPFERSLADLVRAGTVSLEAARDVAGDPKALDDYLGRR